MVMAAMIVIACYTFAYLPTYTVLFGSCDGCPAPVDPLLVAPSRPKLVAYGREEDGNTATLAEL